MAEDGRYVDGSIWFYAPNKPAPIVFAVLFAVSFTIHFWQCMHFKSWKFTGLFPWAALVFVAGYSLRATGAFKYDNVDIFIAATCLVYAAPPVYELANYITLGRVLYYVPYHSPLHPGRVITTFGGISAIVEILTANGASYSSNKKNTPAQRDAGRAMLKAALVIQLGVITCFVLLALYFQRKCRKHGVLPSNLKQAILTLYASSTLIMIRTIYRTVEYFEIENFNFSNTPLEQISVMVRYEWFFWLFEGVTMVLNTYLLNVRHPARFLPRKNNVYLAQDGKTEIEGPGYKNDRNFVLTIFDPFDIIGLVRKKDRQNRFWENQTAAGSGVASQEQPVTQEQVAMKGK